MLVDMMSTPPTVECTTLIVCCSSIVLLFSRIFPRATKEVNWWSLNTASIIALGLYSKHLKHLGNDLQNNWTYPSTALNIDVPGVDTYTLIEVPDNSTVKLWSYSLINKTTTLSTILTTKTPDKKSIGGTSKRGLSSSFKDFEDIQKIFKNNW